MRFIEAVLEYEQFLGEIFLGQNSFSLGNSSEAERKKVVGQYLGEILDVAFVLAALFLLNNYQFVLKTFTQ